MMMAVMEALATMMVSVSVLAMHEFFCVSISFARFLFKLLFNLLSCHCIVVILVVELFRENKAADSSLTLRSLSPPMQC